MYIRRSAGTTMVSCPDGKTLTRADLPPPDTSRWVARRKAAVVHAVEGGLISAEEAMTTWALSEEELASWRIAVTQHGVAALKATGLQQYRR